MEFIINTYDKESIYKIAYLLNGEIVHQNESLVIVKYSNEIQLQEKVKTILGIDVFDITNKFKL